MKLYLATIKSFSDITLNYTIENSYGSTSDHSSNVTVMTDSTSRMTTDLNEIIFEFNDAFRNELDYDKINDDINRYFIFSKHLGYTEIEIIMVDLCKKD